MSMLIEEVITLDNILFKHYLYQIESKSKINLGFEKYDYVKIQNITLQLENYKLANYKDILSKFIVEKSVEKQLYQSKKGFIFYSKFLKFIYKLKYNDDNSQSLQQFDVLEDNCLNSLLRYLRTEYNFNSDIEDWKIKLYYEIIVITGFESKLKLKKIFTQQDLNTSRIYIKKETKVK